MKIEQNSASAAVQEANAAKQQDSQTFKTRNPSILRFKINNYSIKDSVIQVFFSEPEPDGSFLLTGDRKYYLNNRGCTETFYLCRCLKKQYRLFWKQLYNSNYNKESSYPALEKG